MILKVLQWWGSSPQPPQMCSTAAILHQNSQSASVRGGEKNWANHTGGVIRWPGWEFFQHQGTPTLCNKCHGIFNDHTESEPQINVSSQSISITALEGFGFFFLLSPEGKLVHFQQQFSFSLEVSHPGSIWAHTCLSSVIQQTQGACWCGCSY